MKNIDITFDPSKDEVLGVFGEEVHILCGFFEDPNTNDEECIVITPREEYLRIWNLWLDGKKNYCERYNEYCGVMGYVLAEEIKEIDKIILNKFNPHSKEDNEDTWFYIEVPTRTFKVSKFSGIPDFEHG